MARSLQAENLLPQNVESIINYLQYSTEAWGLLAVLYSVVWGLLVAVDHNQLRTMASEAEDPIDWSHPPTIFKVEMSCK